VLYVATAMVPELIPADGSGAQLTLVPSHAARLDSFIAACGSRLVRMRGLVGHGEVAAEIGEIAASEAVGLIVMNTRHSRVDRDPAVRSTAETVALHAGCPVLVIRGEGKGDDGVNLLPWRTILCPTDFGDFCGPALLEANHQAHLFGGELHLLPLPPERGHSGAVAAKVMEFSGASVAVPAPRDPEAKAREIAELISSSARQHEADLIVVPCHGRASNRTRDCGSITEKLIPLVNCPLLVVPSEE